MKQVYNGDEIVVRRISSEYREGDCLIVDLDRGARMSIPWAVAVEVAKGILKVEDESTLKTYEGATSISSSTGIREASE